MTQPSSAVTVTREIQCDIGHRIPFHKAACSNVHGHRYRIAVTVEGPLITGEGRSDQAMVADFGDLKSLMMSEIHDAVDHAFMVWKNDQPLQKFLEDQGYRLVVMEEPPTAEYFAAWCCERMQSACTERFGETLSVKSVTVWETPNCCAMYEPPGAAHSA